jgi:hypothetical protein
MHVGLIRERLFRDTLDEANGAERAVIGNGVFRACGRCLGSNDLRILYFSFERKLELRRHPLRATDLWLQHMLSQ